MKLCPDVGEAHTGGFRGVVPPGLTLAQGAASVGHIAYAAALAQMHVSICAQ
jgi:hypothetical protein